MAQSNSKQVSAPAWLDYSAAEWEEINAAVLAVRPDLPLSKRECAALLRAARYYQSGPHGPPKAEGKAWAKVARLCGKLCEALEAIGAARADADWRAAPALFVPKDLAVALAGKLLWSDAWNPGGELDVVGGKLEVGNLIDLLTELRRSAKEDRTDDSLSLYRFVSYTKRFEPRVTYLQQVLLLWTDVFGGGLNFTRDVEQRPCGPLVRFLFAVVAPVMRDATPALDSVQGIVTRQRNFSTWYDEFVAKINSAFGTEVSRTDWSVESLLPAIDERAADLASRGAQKDLTC
jgi:hypothetical protein